MGEHMGTYASQPSNNWVFSMYDGGELCCGKLDQSRGRVPEGVQLNGNDWSVIRPKLAMDSH